MTADQDPRPPGDEDFLAQNEAIRALQPERSPSRGESPSRRWHVSASLITFMAMIMPVRVRVAFTFGINFLFNNAYAVFRLGLAYLGRAFLHTLIFLAYYLVIGPQVAQLMGEDHLSVKPSRAPTSPPKNRLT